MSKDERLKQYRIRKYIEFMNNYSNIILVEALDKLGFLPLRRLLNTTGPTRADYSIIV